MHTPLDWMGHVKGHYISHFCSTVYKLKVFLLEVFRDGFNQTLSIYSELSRYCTDRWYSRRLFLLGPIKVKGRKFTEMFPYIENNKHLVDFVIKFIIQSVCFNALHSSKVSQSSVTKNETICFYFGGIRWPLLFT